jgi:hypothetical protein
MGEAALCVGLQLLIEKGGGKTLILRNEGYNFVNACLYCISGDCSIIAQFLLK